METVILSSESRQDMKLILQMASKLGISIKKLSKDEIEEIGLSLAIKQGKTDEFIDTDRFLNELENAG